MDLSNAYLATRLFSVRMNRMVKKSNKAEIDRRVHTVVKLLSSAKNKFLHPAILRGGMGGTEATS